MQTPSSRAISRERNVKLFFFLTALILLFVVITKINNLLVSFLLAFVTYYLLAPFVDWMERKGLSRLWATTIPFLMLTAVAATAISIFSPMMMDQFQTLQENFPKYVQTSTEIAHRWENELGVYLKNISPVQMQNQIQPKLIEWAQALFQKAPDILSQSLTVILLVPFLAYFMLLDGRDFVRKILQLVPNSFFELALNLNFQIGSQMGGFIRARLLESILVAGVIWVGLLIMDFPYALILAIFAAILNIIPYLGPLIGAAPAVIIALTNGADSNVLVGLLIVYSVAQVIDTVVLVPFLVAKIVNLHPVTVVLAVLIGAQVMGILGMIICIPIVSALKVTSTALFRHFTDFRT